MPIQVPLSFQITPGGNAAPVDPSPLLLAPTSVNQSATVYPKHSLIVVDVSAGTSRLYFPDPPDSGEEHSIFVVGSASVGTSITLDFGSKSFRLPNNIGGGSQITVPLALGSIRIRWGGTVWMDAGSGLAMPYYPIAPAPGSPPPGPPTFTLPIGSMIVPVDTSNGFVVGVNLHLSLSSFDGEQKTIKDAKGLAATKNIHIIPDSGTIQQWDGSVAGSLALNQNGDSVTLLKAFGNWVIL